MFFLKPRMNHETAERLTAFEEYMLADDQHDYPMCFFLQLEAHGRLDQHALEEAAKQVAWEHPLLSSTVVKKGRTAHAWQRVATPSVVANAQPSEPTIDLTAEVGVRIRVSTSDDTERRFLRFQFHHACCDGRGAMAFVKEVLDKYDALVRSSPPSKTSTDRPEIGPRELALSWRAAISRNAKDGMRIWRFYATTPLVVHSPRVIENATPRYPVFVSHSYTEHETEALLTAARRKHVTLNDLLVRDAYLAIRDWMSDRAPLHPQSVIRISIPLDMRDPDSNEYRCENNLSMVLLDRNLKSLESPDALLQSIADEMQQVKRNRMGIALLRATRWLRWLPGGMNATFQTKRCLTSTVLSNLGRLSFESSELQRSDGRIVAGDLTIESIDLLPPFRYQTPLVFAALTYANRLRLTLHYDDRAVDVASAHSLLGRYAHQLRTVID